ncbi:N-methyl-L-tryptophan oxidase [Peribacillus simplex]|uniref:N-methyl-L-tryptophan oxidase n=1 Tax=Peribacillus simplex TaxID=1478 RepID=UPI00298D7188|nr:N-methyl-L-tryptophan oxidase [Peribacillus simplex]MDW7615365.1 N-methyl-L-tryptophan oxidase [Peribacillus simplex]
MHYDVIVIGAGSMGMSAGYFLSKNGQKVLLLDSFVPPHNKGSHHGETRIIRHAYGEGEEYVSLALKSQKLWNELEKLTGKQLFLPTGVLNAGSQKSTFINQVIASSEKFNLPLEILDSNQIHKRWPGISLPEDYIGCFESTSGVLKSEECIRAYQQLAESHGANIIVNSQVRKIFVHRNGVTIKTDEQTFYAEALVVAAGAWSPKLLAMLDLNVPLAPIRKTFAWFEANELYNYKNFPAFTFDTSVGTYYGFPSINDSGLKVGRHDGGNYINPDDSIARFGVLDEDEGDLVQFLQQFMPTGQKIKHGKSCIYTMTPDENFIVDTHPNYPHIAISAGFSGHGFKFSSVIGEILSDLIISGKSENDISVFSINRFK